MSWTRSLNWWSPRISSWRKLVGTLGDAAKLSACPTRLGEGMSWSNRFLALALMRPAGMTFPWNGWLVVGSLIWTCCL